ncbi:MAG: hypothetical protein GY719_09115 [bacterium]|nr:hypothetical protein [bacterium]
MHREIENVFVADPLLAAQRRLLVATVQLLELDQRLYEEVERLPLPALLIAMEEELMPYNGMALLYSTLQRVKGQYLQPAIQALLEVSQKSDEDLLSQRTDA